VEEQDKDARKAIVLLNEAQEVVDSGKVFMTAVEWANKQ